MLTVLGVALPTSFRAFPPARPSLAISGRQSGEGPCDWGGTGTRTHVELPFRGPKGCGHHGPSCALERE